jgi:hypothetical protein
MRALVSHGLQDWTKLENEDSEGLVEVSYRSGSEPGRPPDIQVIQKQMAIVAWQPGPNRIVQVPTEVCGAAGTAGRAAASKHNSSSSSSYQLLCKLGSKSAATARASAPAKADAGALLQL